MKTREVFNKLPVKVQAKLKEYKNNATHDYRHRELYYSLGRGYLCCLCDVGIITENERKILQVYLTVLPIYESKP